MRQRTRYGTLKYGYATVLNRAKTALILHFVGEVKTISETAVRAEGYVFVFNTVKNEYIRRDAVRTRIISIVDGGNIINVLPQGILLKNLRYRQSKENRLILTDDASFELDINEFGANC